MALVKNTFYILAALLTLLFICLIILMANEERSADQTFARQSGLSMQECRSTAKALGSTEQQGRDICEKRVPNDNNEPSLIPFAFGMYILSIFGLFVYMLPAVIAAQRRHRQVEAIFYLNMLLGWSFIGWVAAFVWSVSNSQPSTARDYTVNNSAEISAHSGPVSEFKACPRCAETVKRAALVCRYCGHEFDPSENIPTIVSYHGPQPSLGVRSNQGVINEGLYNKYRYSIHGDNIVTSHIEGRPLSWRNFKEFKIWADAHPEGASLKR